MPDRNTPTAAADQHARFVELARDLGCEEDEEAFERAVRTVARPKAAGHIPDASSENRGDRDADRDADRLDAGG